jgi:LysM repeat protein
MERPAGPYELARMALRSASRSGPLARLVAAALVLGLGLLWPLGVGAAQTHTVYEGQRLGSIAKRYNVTVEELCAANGLDPKKPIKPGQKLVIPEPGAPKKASAAAQSASEQAEKSEKPAPAAEAARPGKPRVHVVASGHTLSAIAGRYGVTVSALCHASGLERTSSLRVGQRVVVPARDDKGGSYARSLRLRGSLDAELSGEEPEERKSSAKPAAREDVDARRGVPSDSWQKYVKKPWRRGYIKLRGYRRSWSGYVLGPKGEVLSGASAQINRVLGAAEDGPRIDPRLIRLIAQVSDKFGGRELRVVSGYRDKSFVADSNHLKGRALDFSIPGVPNEAVRDYLRTLRDVGVGYYPNSSFVHLDVRDYDAYWIDYAGPGEAPRKSPRARPAKGAAKAKPSAEPDAAAPSADAAEPDAAAEPAAESAAESEPSEQPAVPKEPSPAPAADEGPPPPPPEP